jgi:uncharacterized membrane protein (DUF485 family)
MAKFLMCIILLIHYLNYVCSLSYVSNLISASSSGNFRTSNKVINIITDTNKF